RRRGRLHRGRTAPLSLPGVRLRRNRARPLPAGLDQPRVPGVLRGPAGRRAMPARLRGPARRELVRSAADGCGRVRRVPGAVRPRPEPGVSGVRGMNGVPAVNRLWWAAPAAAVLVLALVAMLAGSPPAPPRPGSSLDPGPGGTRAAFLLLEGL